jgi:hypothetical protein
LAPLGLARVKRWARSRSLSCRARATASSTDSDTLAVRPPLVEIVFDDERF